MSATALVGLSYGRKVCTANVTTALLKLNYGCTTFQIRLAGRKLFNTEVLNKAAVYGCCIATGCESHRLLATENYQQVG